MQLNSVWWKWTLLLRPIQCRRCLPDLLRVGSIPRGTVLLLLLHVGTVPLGNTLLPVVLLPPLMVVAR